MLKISSDSPKEFFNANNNVLTFSSFNSLTSQVSTPILLSIMSTQSFKLLWADLLLLELDIGRRNNEKSSMAARVCVHKEILY